MNDTPKKIAIYARVSTTDKQDVNRQVSELRTVIDNKGWILTDIYTDEGFSRTTITRPALDRMMKDSFTKRFDMVMTLELSRLGSNLKHMIEVVETLKQRGINLWIQNQQIDTSTISGMMFYSILTSINNYERELISERVKSGLVNAKRKGKTLGRKTNLNAEVRNQIIQMKSDNVGMKKISKVCQVGRDTILKVWNSHTTPSELSA